LIDNLVVVVEGDHRSARPECLAAGTRFQDVAKNERPCRCA
jgi:hypothetical protein